MNEFGFAVGPTAAILIAKVVVVLAGFLAWKESRRAYRFKEIRIIAQLIMLFALGNIFLRPYYKTKISNSVILLTPGYYSRQVDSLLKIDPTLKLVHTYDTKPFRHSASLNSYHELSSMRSDISYIIGNGLPPHALELVQHHAFEFIPSPSPEGILQLTLPKKIIANRKNSITGALNNSSTTKLCLSGPGGKEDSIVINKKGHQQFRLNFEPKRPGNFLYTLTVSDGKGAVIETIPVSVTEQRPSEILFMLNYPTFETKYLKNFLGKRDRLTIRYLISRHTYRYEFVNRDQRQINKINKTTLDEFDCIVIDTDALQSLSSAELSSLREAVRSGLGVLVLFNESPEKIRSVQSLLPFSFEKIPTDTASLSIDAKKIVLPAWPLRPQPATFVRPVIVNKNRMLAGYVHQGAGKIGFQLLQETFGLTLKGDSISYSSLWSKLIENISRDDLNKSSVRITSLPPYFEDEPVNVEVIATEEPELFHGEAEVPLAEDVVIDDLWHGRIWAGSPGWHSLTITQDSTELFYYTSEPGAWKSLSIANAIHQTGIGKAKATSEKKTHQENRLVPPWIFFVIFLLSAGFLWLAPKLS
ncbi:MAG: hypothetical protein ACOYXT_23290 [Bacteroidota bacterium]